MHTLNAMLFRHKCSDTFISGHYQNRAGVKGGPQVPSGCQLLSVSVRETLNL